MVRAPRLPVVLLSLLFFLLLPSSAFAGERPRCVANKSVETTIEAIQTEYEHWAGRCVRLRGIRLDWRLYASREAILDKVDIYGDPARRSLVIYPERSNVKGQAHWVELTGRVGSCRTANEAVAAMQDREPNNIIMVSGYCHTSLEHYVRAERIDVLRGERVARFTEPEVPSARRWLLEVPVTVTVPQSHLEAARQLIVAIARQDEDEYLHLTRPASREFRHRDDVEEARSELADDELVTQFRLLANLKGHEEKILVDREALENQSGDGPNVADQFTICWCKSRSCAGRWPVGAFDTDNDPSRPYLCVQTGDWLLGPGQGYVVQVEAMPRDSSPYYPSKVRGLAEPNWNSGPAK